MRTISALLVAVLLSLGAEAKVLKGHRTLEDVPTLTGRVDVVCEAAEVIVRDLDDRAVALMHGYAYLVKDGTDRPVTFFWNGGPGASTAILHTGFASPMRAPIGDEDAEPAANPLTLIDKTDLVYVDPVGTGFSQAVGTAEAEDFWGIYEDAYSAAEFVEGFLSARGMLDRPVYLCGESYGAVRVAAMLEHLIERGIDVEGLILISPALESGIIRPRAGTDYVYEARADRLPTYAALALDRGVRKTDDERAFIEDALEFAHGPYLDALDELDELPESEIERLRSIRKQFTDRPDVKKRDQHDARRPKRQGEIAGIEIDEFGDSYKALLHEVFGIRTGGKYKLMNRRANRSWRAEDGESGLYRSNIRTPRMIARACDEGLCPRVFIAGGWYDLVTPFATNRRLAAEGEFGDCEIEVRDYAAGHVIFADEDAHEELAEDVRAWLAP